MAIELEPSEVEIHGHRVSYRVAGSGPLVVLIHGITGSSQTWGEVISGLAQEHTVIAPDLIGHGNSAKPQGDYSLGAYASGIRDLLGALGHFEGTIVGHSLGGGIAMQFAYQFPERTQRMVLVSSGGLGRDVHVLLRAATLPGSEWVLPLLASGPTIGLGEAVAQVMARAGLDAGPDLEEFARGFTSLHDFGARRCFIQTMRGLLDLTGQRVSAADRLYLAQALPTLLVWGDRDPIIPIEHGLRAHEAMPHSRLEVFEGAGHFPHRTDPSRFVAVLEDFFRSTEPAQIDDDRAAEMLRAGPPGD